MANNELFRVTRDGVKTYGPYDTLYMARNVASQCYGGYWNGKNSDMRPNRWDLSIFHKIQIQKLTPVLKPLEGGSLRLDLEWVDLP